MKRYFIITIDTEGDNLWSVKDVRAHITTRNAGYLSRFQLLCERYGFVVTYLTNYEMAKDETFIKFGRRALDRGMAEIGAHEHAWNSPPIRHLIKSPSYRGKPYLCEYSDHTIREKLRYLTALLETNFGIRVTSHRGGRWCMDTRIAKILCELGYIADCTCTPGISRKNQPGWSIGSQGTDWRGWPNETFVLHEGMDGNRILEVPATVVSRENGTIPVWFRPNGKNVESMLGMIDYLYENGPNYIELMIHSSELMPGGSPTFKNQGQIDKLYEDLDRVFTRVSEKGYSGIGLSDYVRVVGGVVS